MKLSPNLFDSWLPSPLFLWAFMHDLDGYADHREVKTAAEIQLRLKVFAFAVDWGHDMIE